MIRRTANRLRTLKPSSRGRGFQVVSPRRPRQGLLLTAHSAAGSSPNGPASVPANPDVQGAGRGRLGFGRLRQKGPHAVGQGLVKGTLGGEPQQLHVALHQWVQ